MCAVGRVVQHPGEALALAPAGAFSIKHEPVCLCPVRRRAVRLTRHGINARRVGSPERARQACVAGAYPPGAFSGPSDVVALWYRRVNHASHLKVYSQRERLRMYVQEA